MKLFITIVSLLISIEISKAQAPFYDGAADPASKAVMDKAEQDIEKYRKGDFHSC